MFGVEWQKQILGCSDQEASQCAMEIAGALNADRAISGDVSRVGSTVLVNLSLIDLRHNKSLGRVGRRIEAAGDSVEPILDALTPAIFELCNLDPIRKGVMLKPERRFGGIVISARGDGDLLGLGISPSVMAELSGKRLGVALTIIVPGKAPGVRVEGRFYPFELGRLRPFVAVGATAFQSGIGARGAAGAAIRFGELQISLDAAFEYFVSGDKSKFLERAALLGVTAGWAL